MTFIPQDEYDKILKFMPILCVDCVITFNGRCLLLRRNNEPAKNQYWFPGGRINKNETITEAALRKAREETGLECDFIDVISIEETMFPRKNNMVCDIHTVNICCKLTTNNIDQITIDSYHDNYLWADTKCSLELKLHQAVFNPLIMSLDE